MKEKVTVFLPCRSGSQRVPQKNTRKFAGIEGGLVTLKLDQLIESSFIDKIVLSTDDELVKNIGRAKNSNKIVIDDRPAHLASSQTSTDDLVNYVPTVVTEEHIMWTHVTSPLIDSKIYNKAIAKYFEILKTTEHDSLMSVTPLFKFLWNEKKPLNYDREKEKWPRTQTLDPVYEVNSGFFLCSREVYLNFLDRVGQKPFLYKLNDIEAADVDWEEDFVIAETLYKNRTL